MLTFGDNIKRLEQAKADIKEAIEQKGVAVGDGLINTYADKILEIKEAGELETVDVTVTENNKMTSIVPQGEYVGIEKVRIYTDIPIQSNKDITIQQNGEYTVYVDDGYEGMKNVNIDVDIPIDGVQNLTVTENNTYYTIKPSGENVAIESAVVYTDIPMQDKTVDVTSNGTLTISPDNGYEGLNTVNLNVAVKGDGKTVLPNGICLSGSTWETFDTTQYDWSKIRDMKSMFYSCKNLTSLDVSNWDTSNVTDMSSMFNSCSKLTTINGIENWDTSNVLAMSDMFSGCTNVTSLDLSNWDTSKVTKMDYMFRECDNLTSLDLSSWDTSNVTRMDYMFYSCHNLTEVKMGGDVSKVTNVSNMFTHITTTGTFYYNPQYDYSKIIAVLPSTWTAVPME